MASGFLWSVGGSPGDECLAGGYSVDSTYLLNGILHKLILAEAVERSDNIELSRDQVSLDEVREGFQFLEYAAELALDFDQRIGERGLRGLFPVLGIGNVLDRECCLGGCNAGDASDLFDGVECFNGLVSIQSDHEVEASGDWSDGFYVADSFELADNVS